MCNVIPFKKDCAEIQVALNMKTVVVSELSYFFLRMYVKFQRLHEDNIERIMA